MYIMYTYAYIYVPLLVNLFSRKFRPEFIASVTSYQVIRKYIFKKCREPCPTGLFIIFQITELFTDRTT